MFTRGGSRKVVSMLGRLIALRLSVRELARLDERVAAEGTSRSVWVRAQIRRALARKPKKQVAESPSDAVIGEAPTMAE